MTDDDTGDKRRLVYDGDALIAEYAPDGTLLDRYLHGPSGLDACPRESGESAGCAGCVMPPA